MIIYSWTFDKLISTLFLKFPLQVSRSNTPLEFYQSFVISENVRLQISDLYEDMHVTRLPQLDREVRGPQEIESFSSYLVNAYNSRSS